MNVHQTKEARSYENGYKQGRKDGVFNALAVVGAIIALLYVFTAVNRWHDREVENDKAAFASSCDRAGGSTDAEGDVCRSNDTIAPAEWKNCLRETIPEGTEAKVHYDFYKQAADRCTDRLVNRKGHIIMIRDDERTWK